MNKLNNKKIIKSQVKNLIISLLVAGILSFAMKLIPKQPSYQFKGEVSFSQSLSMIAKYLTSTTDAITLTNFSNISVSRLISGSTEIVKGCELAQLNNDYLVSQTTSAKMITFIFYVKPEIDEKVCISSIKKVFNRQASEFMTTHLNILERTNNVYDNFFIKKDGMAGDDYDNKDHTKIIQSSFGLLKLSVDERVKNNLRIELISDTLQDKEYFVISNTALRFEEKAESLETFFIVFLCMMGVMNLNFLIGLFRKL